MSEANVLNAFQSSLLSPDYGYEEQKLPTLAEILADSGKWFGRHALNRGRIYRLGWQGRDKATMHTLRQWAEQYRLDFFTLWDYERARGFSGRFDGDLTISPAGNEQWNVGATFVELAQVAMQTYPSDWARDASFLEERNGFGEDLVKLKTPANWTYQSAQSNLHPLPGAAYNSNVNGETAEWQYFGYGFRVWESKGSNRGIPKIQATRVRDGVLVVDTTVDLYNAAQVDSAVVYTKADLPLDVYRVKVEITNNKNGSSSDYYAYADAIEVMR